MPRLIFLHETTTGLDPRRPRAPCGRSSANLVNNGVTIFLTTQYLDEADQLADQIAVLDHGRMVAQRHRRRAQGPGARRAGGARVRVESGLARRGHALAPQTRPSQAASHLVIATSGSVADMADIFIRLNDRGIEPTRFARQEPDVRTTCSSRSSTTTRSSGMQTLTDTWTMTKRSLRHTTRSLDTIITVVLMPIGIYAAVQLRLRRRPPASRPARSATSTTSPPASSS